MIFRCENKIIRLALTSLSFIQLVLWFVKVWKPELFNISHYTVTAHCYKYEHRIACISALIRDSLKISTDPSSLCSSKIWSTIRDKNTFVRVHFKNKTKKWNFIFTIVGLPCKFEPTLSWKVALGTDGLIMWCYASCHDHVSCHVSQRYTFHHFILLWRSMFNDATLSDAMFVRFRYCSFTFCRSVHPIPWSCLIGWA